MDSLDHAFNSGQRLTQEDIARFVIALAQASDQPNLSRLLRSIQTQDYDMDDYETFVHTLMQNDFADLAAGCLTMGAIRTWCDDNSFEVINQCPAVFERWAVPNSYFVSALGQACEDLDNADKIALLKGRGCNPHEQKLHAFLQREPTLWQYMSPAWLGHANSEQRSAACALGWKMEMLPDMIHQHARRNTVARWVPAFDYAYSMSVATLLWGGQESSAVNKKHLIGMYVDAHANPTDAALAKAMVVRAGCSEVLHVDAKVIPIEPLARANLEGVVDMYLTLGCPQLLIEALMHDRIPSLVPVKGMDAGIALPDLEGPP